MYVVSPTNLNFLTLITSRDDFDAMAPISIMREWLSSPQLAVIPLLLLIVYYRVSKKTSRTVKIPKTGERVLILGASSGIGRTMARQYAERGAHVCVVGRRETQILEAEHECRQAQVLHGVQAHKGDILALPADFTNADDMVRVRETIEASTSTNILFVTMI